MADYCLIPLHGKHGEGKHAKVSPEDYIRLSAFYWYGHIRGYAIRYANEKGNTKGVLMHREIMGFPSSITDHVNGDSLDNRRGNLRKATPAQNRFNARKCQNSRSRYKGVRFENRYATSPWRAVISAFGKRKWLGRYKTEVEAARAYNEAAVLLHGPFARLNEF